MKGLVALLEVIWQRCRKVYDFEQRDAANRNQSLPLGCRSDSLLKLIHNSASRNAPLGCDAEISTAFSQTHTLFCSISYTISKSHIIRSKLISLLHKPIHDPAQGVTFCCSYSHVTHTLSNCFYCVICVK